jgi:hypothetical protein
VKSSGVDEDTVRFKKNFVCGMKRKKGWLLAGRGFISALCVENNLEDSKPSDHN